MKLKPSPAVAISLVALFFSLTGAGIAASRYIITSTHQIKPSVLDTLHGRSGPQGPQGVQGPQGQQGPAGAAAAVPRGALANYDPSQFYIKRFGDDTLSAGHPNETFNMDCGPVDAIVQGGYDGENEIVTSDELTRTYFGPWIVTAHLDPAATSGFVRGWVLCQRA